jgi:hypothetical protein
MDTYIKKDFDKVCKNWKIFEKTYWGGGCYNSFNENGTNLQLFKNRDIVAERYKLKKQITSYSPSTRNYIKKNLIDAMVVDGDILEDKVNKEVDKLERLKKRKATEKEIDKATKNATEEQFSQLGSFSSGFFNYGRDHTEYYLDTDGNTISIFSIPSVNDENLFNDIETSGYKEIEPLYNLKDKTFIKVIPRRRRC